MKRAKISPIYQFFLIISLLANGIGWWSMLTGLPALLIIKTICAFLLLAVALFFLFYALGMMLWR